MEKKKVYGLIIAAIILVGTLLLPVPQGMEAVARNTFGLLVAALVLWVTEAIPLGITALALLILQPIYGITDLNTAFKEFITPVIFFVIATSGISCAIMKTPLANRMAGWLLKKAGRDSGRVVLAFMSGTAIVSSFVSNVPAAALFMGLALSILEGVGAKPGSSRLGKSLMIAIPFGAMIGGITTPAGSSVNILALYLLDKSAQISISFLEWMLYGIPIAVAMIPITSYIIVKTLKPEPIEIDITDILNNKREENKHLTVPEVKVLIILGLMLFFWILSTWVPVINITTVAIVGLIVFFLPGIEVFTWDEFNQEVGWETVIMIGGVTSIGAAVIASGLSTWFLNSVLHGLTGLGVISLTALVGLIMNLLHLVLPIAPAIVAVSIQPLTDMSVLAGISPVILAITTAFLANCSMLLPLDAVPLITYSKKYYSMGDMFRTGWLTSLIWVLLTAIWVPLIAKLLVN